jgi:hypothetical protein
MSAPDSDLIRCTHSILRTALTAVRYSVRGGLQ